MNQPGIQLKATTIALFLLALSLCGLSGTLMAGERRGAAVLVQRTNGTEEEGELIAVKPNSLLLLGSSSRADISIDVPDIKTIRIIKESKAGTGFLVGLCLGAAVGVGGSLSDKRYSGGSVPLLMGGMFGLVGGLIGGVFGSLEGSDDVIDFEGKSESQVYDIMRDLKSKARITNFQ